MSLNVSNVSADKFGKSSTKETGKMIVLMFVSPETESRSGTFIFFSILETFKSREIFRGTGQVHCRISLY